MTPPKWFVNELKCICPKYFVVFDSKKGRWRIRKWNGAYERFSTWRTDSTPIREIHMSNNMGTDIGYAPLDRRALDGLARGLYNARRAKRLLQEIDDANARMIEKEDLEHEYVARYMAKNIWHYYKEPTMAMGVSGGDRPWKH